MVSTCKSSKQTKHVSASFCGCAGVVVVNPAEEDDDFELDLEAVDVVSFGPPVVFMGFIELEFESIPVAMSRGWRFVDFTKSYLITGGTRHERSLLKVRIYSSFDILIRLTEYVVQVHT